MQASSATATAPCRVEYSEGSYANAAVEGDAKGLQPKEAPKRRKRGRTCKVCDHPTWQEGTRKNTAHHCTNSKFKHHKEKSGSCGSAAVPSLGNSSKKKKKKHCKSCREASLGGHLLEFRGKFGSGCWTCTKKTLHSKAWQINEVVYLEFQFLPLLFALQKCK